MGRKKREKCPPDFEKRLQTMALQGVREFLLLTQQTENLGYSEFIRISPINQAPGKRPGNNPLN
jgi:hypothetical protein